MLRGSKSISRVLDSSLMESIIKQIHIAIWQSISQRTWLSVFILQSAAMHTDYSNVCCKNKQHKRVGIETVVWWKLSWEVDRRYGGVTGVKTALLVNEGRLFSGDVCMMRCVLGHRCSTTKLIVVPSKEGGAMILGPCCVVMLITGFLSELAAPPLAVTCPRLTGSCSGPCGASPVAL